MANVLAGIKNLVETFDRNITAYKNQQYNEAQLRREFIDPFFEELGWDVTNKRGYAQAYKDVIHEDAIKIGGATKAPDYCFRIGGVRKFFLEAKKPSLDIKGDPHPAYQLRRYAWSAKLPLSILTDFEEFAVYDCLTRPKQTDKAAVARIMYYTYRDYLEHWTEIESIFSRDAILKGSFDKFAAATKGKRGTTTVDKEFLAEIENWRKMLARTIALKNTELSKYELNFAVQRTIDRILFLRMCEDRGIEPYGQLMGLISGPQLYPRLCNVFRQADAKYNSGLFHFRREKDRTEPPDELTLNIAIDDKDLKYLLGSLYYPKSPYEFSVLPAEILGNVYEQFLGQVIRLTPGHRAIVEPKPEVKKAGGVYYTPAYIVDYIVKNTVGKLCEGKTPKQIADLKILDPACGSGSFLLGAYTCLLDYHRDWYVQNNPESWAKKKNPPIYQVPSPRHCEERSDEAISNYRLTIAEKKRILLNNIFGVDIDSQAVEVTKLSLLLKVLEGESAETIGQVYKMFHERALPDLADNIKCGNSLIGPDFFDNLEQRTMNNEQRTTNNEQRTMNNELYQKINAFDWHAEFPQIFSRPNPGFHAIIGNPPWGSLLTQPEKRYLYARYANRRGEAESHLFFIERAFVLLNNAGLVGFITPNTWLTVLNSKQIRAYLLANAQFHEICQLSKYIFKGAPDIVPILVFFGKQPGTVRTCSVRTTQQKHVTASNFSEVFASHHIPQQIWADSRASTINLYATPSVLRIVKKCNAPSTPLSEICDVLYGIKTGNNKKFLSTIQTNTYKQKALKTGELVRYQISWKGFYLWWCPELAGYRNSPLEVPKIIVQYIRKLSLPRRIIAALDSQGLYYPLNNYSYLTPKSEPYSLLYILGLLNSSLINFYFANTFIDYNIKPTYLQQLPIRTIHFDNPDDLALHDKMVALIERMLALHKTLTAAKVPAEKTQIQRQITATDKQIDNLTYELYNLTEEEIKIVEGEQ